jgi:multiple sugar transport system permease protein
MSRWLPSAFFRRMATNLAEFRPKLGKGRRMKLSLSKKQALWGYAFLLIPLLYFVVVFLIPMVQAFRFSVLDYRTLSSVTPYTGLDNYKKALELEEFWIAMKNTLVYALVRAPTVLVISLVTALAVQRLRLFKNAMRTTLMLPFVTSAVALAWLFNYLYSRLGPVTLVLTALGAEQPRVLLNPDTALYGISAVAVWASIGYYTLLFGVGLDAIPAEIYDAAKVDGASSWQTFWRITLPLLNPTIVLLSVLAVMASLKNFALVRNMTDGGPINSTLTIPLLIYREAFYHLNMGLAAAITVLFFILILVITFVQIRITQRQFEY